MGTVTHIFIACRISNNIGLWEATPDMSIRYLSREPCEEAVKRLAANEGIKVIRHDYMLTPEPPFSTMFAHIKNLVSIFHDIEHNQYFGVIKTSPVTLPDEKD